jgi:signal transduction histidine kinase
MEWLLWAKDWLSGGATQYHPLTHCMSGDTFWITLTVVLAVAVAVGYAVIAFHWRKNERTLPPSPARRALATMRNIFTFCGICGYVFIPVKLVWPAWRLYDLFMMGLVFYTWRYALNVKGLRVLYTAVGRSDQLATDLASARDDARQKGAFLNAISHDLRTPLNGLLLHADLAEMHVAETAADPTAAALVTESLHEIKTAARLTADLLDRLLEYARLDGARDAPHLSDVPLDGLVRDVLAAHRLAAAGKGLDLSASVPAGLLLRTDRLKLERTLNNLVGNAVKYTPAGSVRVTVDAAAAGVEVHVTDTGVGIAPEHVGRLFDEFYQVDNHERDRRKGFGLGLAIGRRLARQLGGDLLVSSTPGRGSRFTVALPGTAAAELTPAQPAGPIVDGVAGLAANGRPPAPTVAVGEPGAFRA